MTGTAFAVAARQCAGWGAALLLSMGSLGCGSDPASPSHTAAAGAGGAGDVSEAGAPGTQLGDGGAQSSAGGSEGMPVAPGDLVCRTDDDCTSADKPVCDQVQGCVACQYDWDCPAAHRCRANQCFEKQACASADDCQKDSAYPVCDAVQQLCVGCREDADCGEGKRCDGSECVAFEACTNSRGCADGKVCDRALGACVACVVDGDCGAGSACVHDTCVPTCQSDKECLAIGLLCDQAVGRCVECLGHADCPAQYFCGADHHCALDVCQTSQARCSTQHELGICSDAGDQFIGSTCAGDTRCVEDGQTASCVPLACSPGGSTCSADGAAVEHCSADGLTVAATEPCPAGQACNEGACKDVICTPNAALCKSNALYKCNATGTQTTLQQTCSGQQAGICDEASGSCKPKVCVPNLPACDGNLATVCAPDGLGLVPNGTDCSLTDGACWNGSCAPRLCTGSYVCDGSLLKLCKNNGTVLQLSKDCQSAALCDAAGAKCMTPTCTPGAFTCDGTVATRCKADGSGYVSGGINCADTNQVCDGGGCLPKVCTASAIFCLGGNPEYCGASGATYAPADTCTVSEYCSEGSSYCLLDKCTAGAAVCNGNLATSCQSDGSGPVAGGTDCTATNQICDAGACKAVTCTSGALTCQGEAVYACNANGTGTVLSKTCLAAEFCDTSGEKPACSPDICTAAALGCDGEVISTCGANGGSWTSPGTDCKATNQVCILGGTCAAEESATQGTTTYSSQQYANETQLAVLRTLTPRKLTRIELQASFPGLQKLTWVVYQKRAGAETFDLVYQKVTSQSQATLAVITSPALDFELEKGKTYAIGVHITGTATVLYQYSATSTLYVAKAAFIASSYAALAGGLTSPETTMATPPSTAYKTYLKLTTVLP